MNLNDLIRMLTDLRESIAFEKECEEHEAGNLCSVISADQPNYPLVGEIVNIMGYSTAGGNAYRIVIACDNGSGYGDSWMFDDSNYGLLLSEDELSDDEDEDEDDESVEQ